MPYIRLKRGTKSQIQNATLQVGELLYATDTYELAVVTAEGKQFFLPTYLLFISETVVFQNDDVRSAIDYAKYIVLESAFSTVALDSLSPGRIAFLIVNSIRSGEQASLYSEYGFTYNGASVSSITLTPADNGKIFILYREGSSSPITVEDYNFLTNQGNGELFLTNNGSYQSIPNTLIRVMEEQPFYYTDFLGPAGAATIEAGFPLDVTLIGSGTQGKIAGEPNHPGILRISSSTTANSGALIASDPTAFRISGGEYFEVVFQHKVASGTNTTLRFAYLDTTNQNDATDGVYFEIPANSLNLVGKTANNSTRSTTSSSYTLSVDTWYKARIEVNANATEVTYYLYAENGTLLWSNTLSTNIPTASGRETGVGLVATNSGTTATVLVYCDYMSFGYLSNRKLIR